MVSFGDLRTSLSVTLITFGGANECDVRIWHQEGAFNMEDSLLSSTQVGAASGEQRDLPKSSIQQRGRKAAQWATAERKRQLGEPEQEDTPVSMNISLKEEAKEFQQQI